MKKSSTQTILVTLGSTLTFIVGFVNLYDGNFVYGISLLFLSSILFSAGNTLRLSKEIAELKK